MCCVCVGLCVCGRVGVFVGVWACVRVWAFFIKFKFILIILIKIRFIIGFLSFSVFNFFGAGQILKYSNLNSKGIKNFEHFKDFSGHLN